MTRGRIVGLVLLLALVVALVLADSRPTTDDCDPATAIGYCE